MTPRHLLLAVFVMMIWGFNFVVAKTGLTEFPPLFLMALRFGLVGLTLIWFVKPPGRQLGRILMLSVTLGSLHFSLMFTGLTRVDASVASIAIQLQVPFAAMLAAFVFKDRLGWRRAVGMALAFAGIVVIAGQPRVSADIGYLLLVIAASFVWAVANIQVKALGEINGWTLNAWISMFAAPQLLLISLLVEHGQWAALETATWRGWGSVGYMGIVVTMVGYGIWYRLIAGYPTNQTMPFTLLVPVFGVLSGMAVLGEPFTWQMVVGGLATVSGVGIIVRRRPPLAERPEV